MEINKGFLTGTVIRTEHVRGNRKADGKPFHIQIATVRWHCNEEQSRRMIPVDAELSRGQIVGFEPVMQSNGDTNLVLVVE